MLDTILNIIAPHYCCGCQQSGSLLCVSCIYNIIEEYTDTCINCGKLSAHGVCSDCSKKVAYQKGWCVGARDEALKELIDRYKFHNAKAAYKPLASLLDQTLPLLPKETIVVPIPTIGRHIRMRGYDHAQLLAKAFAKKRHLWVKPVLRRQTNSVQRNATSARDREKQAAQAFRCAQKLNKHTPYLVVDDVITTGATIRAAAKCLQKAGAQQIFIAAIARQPLDSAKDL